MVIKIQAKVYSKYSLNVYMTGSVTLKPLHAFTHLVRKF